MKESLQIHFKPLSTKEEKLKTDIKNNIKYLVEAINGDYISKLAFDSYIIHCFEEAHDLFRHIIIVDQKEGKFLYSEKDLNFIHKVAIQYARESLNDRIKRNDIQNENMNIENADNYKDLLYRKALIERIKEYKLISSYDLDKHDNKWKKLVTFLKNLFGLNKQ